MKMTGSSAARKPVRNHTMDLLRLIFAVSVILSHASEIVYGNASHELAFRLTHQVTMGNLGVDGFFLLSGYLILKSWMSDPNLLDYLRKRVLRIVPGYLVAAVLSTIFVGAFASAVPGFFRNLGWPFVMSILLLDQPQAPPVFPGAHISLVNGAMWSIAFEFRCYLLVALLGVLGLLRRWVWLLATVLMLATWNSARLTGLLYFPWGHEFTGWPPKLYQMTAVFLVGGCFFLFRDRIRFTPLFAWLSVACLVATRLAMPRYIQCMLVIFGGYLMFYLVSLRFDALDWMKHMPDISYGVYLYGWPVEMFIIWKLHYSPWVVFACSVPFCLLLGWASWEWVERPMLKLKRKPSAPLTV